jgi:hypothetical protein
VYPVFIRPHACTRFTVECFRADFARGAWFGGWLTTYQLMCLVIVMVSGTVLLRRRLQRVPAAV